MAEKAKTTSKIEREYVIPLRNKTHPVPIYKKTPKAVKTVKEFIAKHMSVADRDLNKVKLDKYLNEALWYRGIRKPIHKIKVKAVKEGDIVRVYALDLPTNINYKKIREEKKSLEQKEIGEKAKKEIEAQKKAEEEAEKAQIESAEEESGVPKEVAKKEAELDVKETKKAEEKTEKKAEKEKGKAVEEEAQAEMKEEAKANKTTPKKGKEKLAEKKSQDRTSQGQ